jgi:polyhydroxyalkanoate synthesis regulator phasin
MSKKEYLEQMIRNFEENVGEIPTEVRQKIEEVKQGLAAITETELVMGADGAVSEPASEQSVKSQHPVDLLREVYDEMEAIAFSQPDPNAALQSAIYQMRGYMGIPDRYWP